MSLGILPLVEDKVAIDLVEGYFRSVDLLHGGESLLLLLLRGEDGPTDQVL